MDCGPPRQSRTYSSIYNAAHVNPLLDDLLGTGSWTASQVPAFAVGSWMEMDAGESMLIRGVVTQGRGEAVNAIQFVKAFRIEYRQGDSLGSNVALSGTFSTTTTAKTTFFFDSPIFARYIRIVVLQWSTSISMRAGLLVNSYTSCFASATSLQGSVFVDACTCLSGAYKSVNAVHRRATALVPGGAQLSTLANRNTSTCASTAVFDSTAGPTAKGGVTFNRDLAQYLDGGQHTFKISTNGGFTAVVVVKFTGMATNSERIFDFGDGENMNNILMWRISTTSSLFYIGMQNGNQRCQLIPTASVLTDTWTTIVVRYTSSTRILELRTGGTTDTILCTFAIADRTVTKTFVGKSNWASDAYSNVTIAGLYAVDAALSDPEIVQIVADMYMGNDVLQSCQACSQNTVSGSGSTQIEQCECVAGSFKSILPPDVNRRALVLVPLRAQLLDPTSRSTDLINLKTGVDGWRLVRFLPPTSKTWYSQNDNLLGISSRGTAYDYNTEWSVPFGVFDEFCFSTLYFNEWTYCSKNAAIGEFYNVSSRPVLKSSLSNTSHTISFVYRQTVTTDPFIKAKSALYSEALRGQNLEAIATDGGMCVWVRSSDNKPSVDPTGGPGRRGALSFDRSLSQYLDGGSRTLNIASNGGLTFVSLVMFATWDGSVANMCLLDFKGTNNERLVVSRTSADATKLSFYLRDAAGLICNMWSFGDIIENTWLTLVGTSQDRTIIFKIGNGMLRSYACNNSLSDFRVTHTLLGASTYALNPDFHGLIAGLYIVDAALGDIEIAEISDRMARGDIVLQACASCPFNTFKVGVGNMLSSCAACPLNSASAPAAVVVTNCTCNAGVIGDDGGPCTLCVAGTYKEKTGSLPSTCDLCPITTYSTLLGATNISTCQICPPDSDGPRGSNVRSNCSCNAGFTGANGETYLQCAQGTFKFTSGSAACTTVACPSGQFASAQASNVARMCTSTQNIQCPATLSTVLAGGSAAYGNDGLFGSLAHSAVQAGPHTFMINFQQNRSIQFVKSFNRADVSGTRSDGAEIRVGSSTTWQHNTVCATLNADAIQILNCNGIGQYIFIVARNANALNFIELQAFSACTPCPLGTTSPENSVAPTACQCLAGSFEEVAVSNLPSASRSYSSTYNTAHLASRLDDLSGSQSWAPSTNNANGEFMELDTGSPMHVVGLITQGRGPVSPKEYVTKFQVEYRLGDVLGAGQSFLNTTFSMSSLKREHTFSPAINARYIRIKPTEWNSWIGLHVALVVKSCALCIASAESAQGSTSESACSCKIGTYRLIPPASSRAVALVPGHAQFSTLQDRTSRVYESTAIFDSTAGLPSNNRGAATFDRTLVQYLSGGAQKFLISSNTGFTVIANAMFTGTAATGAWERIIDFGITSNDGNIVLARSSTSTQLTWGIRNGAVDCAVLSLSNSVPQNTWLRIVAQYYSSNFRLNLTVNGVSSTVICPSARTDKITTNTFVGRSLWTGDASFQGKIAGLYAVDALLPDAEISQIISSMDIGDDTLQVCALCPPDTYKTGVGDEVCTSCPLNSRSIAGATALVNFICDLGYTGPDGSPCTLCTAGKFKSTLGSLACTSCGAGKYSVTDGSTNALLCLQCTPDSNSQIASSSKAACTCNAGSAGLDGGPCNLCVAGTYKTSSGPTPPACTGCVSGKYSTTVGATSITTCLDCPLLAVPGPQRGGGGLQACCRAHPASQHQCAGAGKPALEHSSAGSEDKLPEGRVRLLRAAKHQPHPGRAEQDAKHAVDAPRAVLEHPARAEHAGAPGRVRVRPELRSGGR